MSEKCYVYHCYAESKQGATLDLIVRTDKKIDTGAKLKDIKSLLINRQDLFKDLSTADITIKSLTFMNEVDCNHEI